MDEINASQVVAQLKTSLSMTSLAPSPSLTTDMICLSHLRWDFVFQRPQHLMTRFARHRRVFFIEEPIYTDTDKPHHAISARGNGLYVVVPTLPHSTDRSLVNEIQRDLMSDLMRTQEISDVTLWYYTPMALAFTNHIKAQRVIYDCMDELSLFKGAPQELIDLEEELFERADRVYTGGHSLYEAKRDRHSSVHAFPSSIDFEHFARARKAGDDPEDQRHIPHPRIGFFGVLDERADLELIQQVAELRPDWHLVLIGPVVKIDPATLPKRDNIHYLGMKSYSVLPDYLAHWDLAMMPFALNESTRFISPTKTPEYLAAGRPVVSTPIRDVVRPYGEQKLVYIANNAEQFVKAAEEAMHERENDKTWLERIDSFLSKTSWEQTWSRMARLERAIATTAEVETLPLMDALKTEKLAALDRASTKQVSMN